MRKKTDNIFKRWWKLTSPNKHYLAGQIVTYIFHALLLASLTIFAAKTINYMYNGEWKLAFIFLGIEISTIVLRNIIIHFEYKYYCKQVAHVRYTVAKKVYNKILSCKDASFNQVSKEKIINITLNNTDYLAEFPDTIANVISVGVHVIFVLITVFISNVLAGLIVCAIGVLNFFAFYFFNKKLGKIMLKRFEKKDDMFRSYSKVINGREVIKELQSKEKYEGEVMKEVEGFNEAYSKYYHVYSWKGNLYYAFWNVIVYAITAFLLYKVSNGTLDIAIYLIIVPYLTSCTDKLNSMFDKISMVENMRVDVDRVNLILNLTDKELIKYGKLNKNAEGYNLGLINVSCDPREGQIHKIKNADISFKPNAINVIKGAKLSGKRTIFNLLRRRIRPDDGKILLDNLDLYEYDDKTFKSHINYCSSNPRFVEGSIKENLLLTKKEMPAIEKACSQIGILSEIQTLPMGFDTQISSIDSSSLLFMLGLTRALLSDCKILMIYEIPEDTPKSFRKEIVDFLKLVNTNKTIILFTHSDEYDEISSLTYEIDKGKVKIVRPRKTSSTKKSIKRKAKPKSKSKSNA